MKKLKALLVGIMLLVAASCASAQPADTVRVVSNAESDKVCSAVVIAPGFALTARHCLSTGMAVDGIVVDHVRLANSVAVDIAVLAVPALACPCAELGGRPAHGTRVVAIGYPGRLEGERRTTEVATVNYIGSILVIAPWYSASHPYSTAQFIFTNRAIIEPGDSGGGLFAWQNGRWLLVGINAISVHASAADREKEQASGFTPVGLAYAFLPRELQ